jgi:predicted transposase/invertase (TIGR01784 family)
MPKIELKINMKTDNIFYQLFQTLPDVLFNLLEEPLPNTQYSFSSLQLKELARTIDGVFLPSHKNHSIYFIEVQFQKDESLYARLLI